MKLICVHLLVLLPYIIDQCTDRGACKINEIFCLQHNLFSESVDMLNRQSRAKALPRDLAEWIIEYYENSN
jgi:hypothetical protein